MVKHLYAPRIYYERIRAFLAEYQPSGPRIATQWCDVKAFGKSLWIMGVWTRGRREYWKFMTHVLLRHRQAFSEAMTLAITGLHFRRIAATI